MSLLNDLFANGRTVVAPLEAEGVETGAVMSVECEALRARMRAAREAIKEAKDDLRKFGPESAALVGAVPEIATLVAEIDQFKREVVARRPDIV